MSKHPKLVSVQVRKGDIQKALKIFKRRVSESGHLFEVRKRQEFVKPTTRKRKQKLQAIRQNQRQVILEKIDNGDTSVRLHTKKRKKGSRR
jgi:ribosomal protein S21|tara:strand:- start:19872 stop:20144 length:273 start_codon:yes stop_codon:yes gene_type:complete